MAAKRKNIWILIIFLSGLVVGGLLGKLASRSTQDFGGYLLVKVLD